MIDPVESLIEYVQYIKPYHAKLLDTFIELSWEDKLNVGMEEDYDFVITFQTSPIETSCNNVGYGIVYDSSEDGTVFVIDSIDFLTNSFEVSGTIDFNPGDKLIITTSDDNYYSTIRPYSITTNLGVSTIISMDYLDELTFVTGMKIYRAARGYSDDECLIPNQINEWRINSYLSEHLSIVPIGD